jgi:hypothetical protein
MTRNSGQCGWIARAGANGGACIKLALLLVTIRFNLPVCLLKAILPTMMGESNADCTAARDGGGEGAAGKGR